MLKLAFQSLLSRKGVLLLVLFSLTLSVLLFLGVERTREISRSSFSRTISGTDLIIGARTGPVNLLLYAVFHRGQGIANMKYASYRDLADRPEVAWAIPLSLGDSYRGHRVVGTTAEYFRRYRYGGGLSLDFARGDPFASPFQVVAGARVAALQGLVIGQELAIVHGAGNAALHSHDNLPFRVSGILEATGTPTDNSLFIPLEGMTAIHIGWETGMQTRKVTPAQALAADLTPRDITAVLIGLESRSQTFRYQRSVNDYDGEALSAVLPGQALYELWQLIGTADKALTFLSGAVVCLGLLSLLAAQLAVLSQRRREMALFRALGASPGQLFLLLFLESWLLTLTGSLAGIGLLYAFQTAAAPFLQAYGFYAAPAALTAAELRLLLILQTAGTLTGTVPALWAYKQSLSDGIRS